ncbi:DUF6797 domain-containing protein [Humisphaera borealis]|uniref:DUF6797 domain-containing protein n=1 Tax=Humisphaera borealis TaxID=2807512 RepID=A0A7M2WZT1_9BACT|nr:DUF6797 domain-containing protein [Humisphaera borealis]QOV91017.1 hypothetical protein IPV69_06560 [Humisphaera borealis]
MTDLFRLARFLVPAVCVMVGTALPTSGQEKKPDAKAPVQQPKPAPKKSARWSEMDYGPFLTASIISHPQAKFDNGPGSFSGDSTARGVAIKLSPDWKDGVVFDMDLMRMSAGWVDGSLKLVGLIADGGHGMSPTIGVPPMFQTPHLPGWAGPSGGINDPRENRIDPLPPAGPLPRSWAKYKGLYRHGEQVVLSYSVGNANVLELPSLEATADGKAIVRTIRVDKSDKPLTLVLADAAPAYPFPKASKPDPVPGFMPGKLSVNAAGTVATVSDMRVVVAHLPAGARLSQEGSILLLELPAVTQPTTFKVFFTRADERGAAAMAKASPQPVDLTSLINGGPSLWKQTVVTQGKLGTPKPDDGYVIDNLTIPHDNPYKAWMRPGGMDFFADGTSAALSTWSGDVWTVSGIDEKLEKLEWKRVATGLHQPLGLKIVDGKIYTVGHDQITRLNDLNGDGETDFYENFNNDWELTTAFHAFCFDLQTDKAGNFYFAFGSPVHAGGGGFQKITNSHGTIMKVSPDGQKNEVYATGFRAPNGIGLNVETGQITASDNEGTWVPKVPLHWVKPGSFNGVVDAAHRPMKSTNGKPDRTEEPKPLCWFPKNVDNSNGGQVWVTSDLWGPFKGDLLHTSYGTSSLYKVMYEELGGQVQGGVVKIPVKFSSSAMRPRFNTKDGQLYVAGLKGWQSNAASDGGFDRVRYTGQPVRMPTKIRALENGLAITFSCKLDPATAADAGSYGVEAYNYKWTGGYGSGEFKPSAPDQKGKDEWEVKSAKLSADGMTVVLEIAGIKPVMQYSVDYNLKSSDGKPLRDIIYGTIHNLGKAEVTTR